MRRTATSSVLFVALLFVGAGCKPSAEDVAHKDSCDKWPKFNDEYATCWSKEQESCISVLPIEDGKKFQVFKVLDRKVLYESEEAITDPAAFEKAMKSQMKKMRCL